MKRQGFTLVEIMIVVLIIGLLAAIAIPNFIKARNKTQINACLDNLRQIEGAKEMWAMENKKSDTDTPGESDLAPDYIKVFPSCPAGGTYTVGAMSARPSCSVTGHDLE